MRYQHDLYTAKSTFSGSIFIHLAVFASQIAKSGEIQTKFDPAAVQGHLRSWCQWKAHM